MNRHAVAVLIGLEVRQRIRSTRWQLSAALLFTLVSVVVFVSLYLTVAVAGMTYREWSENLLDITLGLVLFLGFAAAPTLSATAVNGDRRDATLALVQATPISAWDLAVGKLLGSWLAALALIGAALPYLVWGAFSSRTSILYGILAIVVVALIMLAYCAIGLAFSTLTTRPAASAMLTQASVLLLLIGLPVAFGASFPLTERTHHVTVAEYDYLGDSVPSSCTLVQRDKPFHHPEYTWWLLSPNPVLMVSDTLLAGVDGADERSMPAGGAGFFAFLQSAARTGPDLSPEQCNNQTGAWSADDDDRLARHIGDSWYIGLLVTLLLGLGAVTVAASRLRVPARKLGRGVRVA